MQCFKVKIASRWKAHHVAATQINVIRVPVCWQQLEEDVLRNTVLKTPQQCYFILITSTSVCLFPFILTLFVTKYQHE